MKRKNIYTFIVVLLCCTICSNTKAQSYGVEQNSNGSYTIYMNGGSITTNNMGQYSSPSYQYDMSTGQGSWTNGQGSMCNGCYGVPNYTYSSNSYAYQNGNNTYYLAANPTSGYDPSLSFITSSGIYFKNSAGTTIGFVPMAVPNGSGGYAYISGFYEGCPSCATTAATQAAATQWNNTNISLFQTQSATLQQSILASMQAQMTTAWNQLNWYNYNYYYYSVAYLTNGNTGAAVNPPSPFPPSPADTLKPTKIICNDTSIAMNQKLTATLDSVRNTPEMQNARDSAKFRKFEVGFSVNRIVPSGTPILAIWDYNKSGHGRSVTLTNTNNTVVDLHIHPFTDSAGHSNMACPSPPDMYGLYETWSGWPGRKFFASYVIHADSLLTEYAIAITDTAALNAFWTTHPKDSVLDMRPTIMVGGVATFNPHVNNWQGDDLNEKTYWYQYIKAKNDFLKEGYPNADASTYANVYMLKKLGMGVKMYKNIDGQFKELNYAPTTDTENKVHKRVTICL